MTINKNNYEAFFLDYLEGRLDAQQVADISLFLESNPVLKMQLEEMEMVILEPDSNIFFPHKEEIKKPVLLPWLPVTEENYEQYLVGLAEGDLTNEEVLAVNRFLKQNPSLQNEYWLIEKSRLTPDLSIVYPGKEELKQKAVVIFPMRRSYYYFAAAASVLLMVALFRLFEPVMVKPPQMVTKDHEFVVPPSNEITEASTSSNGVPAKSETVIAAETPVKKNLNKPRNNNEPQHRATFAVSRLEPLPISFDAHDLLLANNLDTDERLDVSRYFGDIMLAQSIRYDEPAEEERGSYNLLAQGAALVKGIFKPEGLMPIADPGTIDWWEIADLGVKGFSRLTSSSIEFTQEKDESGKVKAFALQSNSFNINRELSSRKD